MPDETATVVEAKPISVLYVIRGGTSPSMLAIRGVSSSKARALAEVEKLIKELGGEWNAPDTEADSIEWSNDELILTLTKESTA